MIYEIDVTVESFVEQAYDEHLACILRGLYEKCSIQTVFDNWPSESEKSEFIKRLLDKEE